MDNIYWRSLVDIITNKSIAEILQLISPSEYFIFRSTATSDLIIRGHENEFPDVINNLPEDIVDGEDKEDWDHLLSYFEREQERKAELLSKNKKYTDLSFTSEYMSLSDESEEFYIVHKSKIQQLDHHYTKKFYENVLNKYPNIKSYFNYPKIYYYGMMISLIIQYITKEPSYNNRSIINICGEIGTGKTFLMNILKKLLDSDNHKIKFIDAAEISSDNIEELFSVSNEYKVFVIDDADKIQKGLVLSIRNKVLDLVQNKFFFFLFNKPIDESPKYYDKKTLMHLLTHHDHYDPRYNWKIKNKIKLLQFNLPTIKETLSAIDKDFYLKFALTNGNNIFPELESDKINKKIVDRFPEFFDSIFMNRFLNRYYADNYFGLLAAMKDFYNTSRSKLKTKSVSLIDTSILNIDIRLSDNDSIIRILKIDDKVTDIILDKKKYESSNKNTTPIELYLYNLLIQYKGDCGKNLPLNKKIFEPTPHYSVAWYLDKINQLFITHRIKIDIKKYCEQKNSGRKEYIFIALAVNLV